MEILNIRQTIFRVDKDRSYTFDVNSTITFHYLKRMISAAAHLPKNGFRIYHNTDDYTDQDDFTLCSFFPDLQKIEFTLHITRTQFDPDESIIKLKLNEYCSNHSFKYFSYYCYTCQCSICSICFQSDHKNHNVIEKYDYLQSSRHLVDRIFTNPQAFLADEKVQKQSEANDLKIRLNNILFNKLHEMLTQCEKKVNDLIDFFNESSMKAKKNIEENSFLIKEYCAEGLDQLKEDIGIDKIIVNEEIFLTFDKKYKEIEKNKYKLKDDLVKFGDLNQKYYSIESLVKKIYSDIFSLLDEKINMKNYMELKNQINDHFVDKITKEEIIRKIFTEIKVPRKSLKKNPFLDSSNSNISSSSIFINSGLNNNLKISPKNLKDNTSFTQSIYQPLPLETIHEHISSTQNVDMTSMRGMNNLIIKGDNIIMYPITKTKSVIVISDSNSNEKKEIDFPPISRIKEFPENLAHCNYKGKLYMTGGKNAEANQSKTFLKYDPSYLNVVIMAPMEYSRSCHSMFAHDDYIYAIGGIDNNTTERFSLNTMKWESMNSMNFRERQYPILHVFRNFLYAFCGYSKDNGCMNTIEKINLRNPRAKWELVAYQNPNQLDLALYGCGLIEMNEELFFFGGKNNKEVLSMVFTYSFSDNTFRGCTDQIEYLVYFSETKLHLFKESEYWNIGELTKMPLCVLINSVG